MLKFIIEYAPAFWIGFAIDFLFGYSLLTLEWWVFVIVWASFESIKKGYVYETGYSRRNQSSKSY